MKNQIYLFLKIVLYLPLIALVLTGCWDRHELNNIGIVMGVVIDKSKDIGKIHMTLQMVKSADINSSETSTSSTSKTKAYINLKNEGNTILDTIKNFSKESSRKLLYEVHIKIKIKEYGDLGDQYYP